MRVSDFEDSTVRDRRSAYRQQRAQLALARIDYFAGHTFRACALIFTGPVSVCGGGVRPKRTDTHIQGRSVVLDSNLDKSSADQINPAAKPKPDNTDVQLPDEKKSFDKLLQEVQASTALPDDMRDVLPDQPKVEQPDVNSVLNEIERSTAQTLSNDPNATA